MNLHYLDWIWHVRGRLALALGQTGDDVFARLDPLFHQVNTTHQRTGDTLTFRKRDQAAQDKMSIFDAGVLRIDRGPAGSVLRYDLTSRALLLCFLAPLMFLGIAQMTKALVAHETAKVEAGGKEKAAEAAAKDKAFPLNPIDKFLGAPAPEKPKKKGVNKDKPGRDKLSATPALVFAGIFALLYVVGRILEDWLIRRLFRKSLLAAADSREPCLTMA